MPDALTFTARALAPGAASAAEMTVWKALVDTALRTNEPLTLVHAGGANRITSYRLYFMLLFAKEAGVSPVVFRADVSHWDAEAREWLDESPADETFAS